MDAKLGADAASAVGDYVILAACNPGLASKALAAQAQLGALLPCNVVVRSAGGERSVVETLDPHTMLQPSEGDGVGEVPTTPPPACGRCCPHRRGSRADPDENVIATDPDHELNQGDSPLDPDGVEHRVRPVAPVNSWTLATALTSERNAWCALTSRVSASLSSATSSATTMAGLIARRI